jgi:hypothetical protein
MRWSAPQASVVRSQANRLGANQPGWKTWGAGRAAAFHSRWRKDIATPPVAGGGLDRTALRMRAESVRLALTTPSMKADHAVGCALTLEQHDWLLSCTTSFYREGHHTAIRSSISNPSPGHCLSAFLPPDQAVAAGGLQ